MTLVDRFVCRRERHVPVFTVYPNPWITTYITTCNRCGKVYEERATA